jgi:hypothetical protein
LALFIRCTNPNTVTDIGTTASTHHPPPWRVRGEAHGAWGLDGPSPGFPNQQPAPYSQPSQGLAVLPLRPNAHL